MNDPLTLDLLRPEAYPTPHPGRVELRETHVSSVFLTEGDVYKVKKPVRFAFLDFSDVEARRRACEAEVVLNARLAAGTYLGVVPIRRDASGRHHFGPEGEVVDWAVHMVRLPDAFRADQRLAAATLSPAHVDAMALSMADFHARARTDAVVSEYGKVSAIARNVRDNFEEVDPCTDDLLGDAEAAEAERWQLDFLRTRARVFERRCSQGRIRDGHGDLRLDHFYLGNEGELTVIDCIEFDERFRFGDVCSDIAFLSMDLAARGRVDLAERLLAKYARASDDFELYALVDFYEAYRAWVRGKISALTARQASGDARFRALADARRHFTLALSAGRRSVLDPVVVAVGGVIASGKSTVAEMVADRLSAPIVDADRTRKHLLGVAPTLRDASPAFAGAYSRAMTERVYAEVLHRASFVLESGRPVVLDASFRTREMRDAARDLAAEHGVPFLVIECRAKPDVCRARLARRQRGGGVSDGRIEVFDAFLAETEPMIELAAAEHVVVDTERPLEDTMRAVAARLPTWPRGLCA